MTFKKGEVPKGAKPFKKGESGNPKGREVGTRNRATIAKKWLETNSYWVNPFTKKKMLLSYEDQITIAQIYEAREGKRKNQAYKNLMDSRHGAPKQEVQHSGEVEIGFDISGLSDDDLKTLLAITSKAKSAKPESE